MGAFGDLWHGLTHPQTLARETWHGIKHAVHEAITHPVMTAELVAAPFTGGASLALLAPTELALHHHNSIAADLASGVGASTASGQRYIKDVVDPVTKSVNKVTADIHTLTAPIVADVHAVTGLVQSVNDHLITPIASDIHYVMNLVHGVQRAEADDLHHGILGMLRFAGDVSASLTSADAVLARSNQQLGEDERATASDVLVPGMQYAGAIPGVMGVFHDALTRARASTPATDFPPVDVHGPKEVPELQDLLKSAIDFVLHPGKMRDAEIKQANEVIGIYRSEIDPGAQAFLGIMGNELEKGLAELTPSLSWITRAIFELFLAARGIDVMYEQQEELWRQDLRAATPAELLGVGDLIQAERRGIITHEKRVDQGLKTGLDESRQQVEWELSTWLIPPAVGIDWLARGLITETRLAEIMTWNGVAPQDVESLMDGSYTLASPHAWLAVWARQAEGRSDFLPESLGTEIPVEIAAQYDRVLIAPEQATLDWAQHWKIPPVAWWMTAYFRGIRTYSELESAARAENIPPDVIPDLLGVERETIQQWMLPDIVSAGIISDEDFSAYGDYIGLDPSSTALLLKWGKSKIATPSAGAAGELAKVNQSTSTTLYDAGTITRDVLLAIYRAHGYTADAAELAVEAIDLKHQAKERVAAIEDLAAEVDIGRRTELSAIDKAHADGYTAREIERLDSLIKHKTLAKSKLPSESQMHKMATQDLLTTAQYVGGLELLGYSPEWARMVAASELGLSITELEAKL